MRLTTVVQLSIAALFLTALAFVVSWNRSLQTTHDHSPYAQDRGTQYEAARDFAGMCPEQLIPARVAGHEARPNSERVQLLALGIDRRSDDTLVTNTDSIIIVSVDLARNRASILSVPRDLYVHIPGRGCSRINAAFKYGADDSDFAQGARLSMQTIERNLGIHIDHYVLVDFAAVIRGIDALGGIDVQVPTTLDDPTFPAMDQGYEPLYIAAGQHHFDGSTALKYARTRCVGYDFGRAQRQQQVVLAVRHQARSLGLAGFFRAGTLFLEAERGVHTDLSFLQLVRLATILVDIPRESIQQAVLDYDYVSDQVTETGAQVLILDYRKAAPLFRQLFAE